MYVYVDIYICKYIYNFREGLRICMYAYAYR